MVDDGTLAVISAAIVGFGIVAFVFRVQRELDGRERRYVERERRAVVLAARRRGGRPSRRRPDPGDVRGSRRAKVSSWLPLADRLLIGSVTAAILLVLFPIALAGSSSILWGDRLPAAACSGSVIAVAGYIPAILARYRNLDRSVRDPVERAIVIGSAVFGVAAAVGSFFLTS